MLSGCVSSSEVRHLRVTVFIFPLVTVCSRLHSCPAPQWAFFHGCMDRFVRYFRLSAVFPFMWGREGVFTGFFLVLLWFSVVDFFGFVGCGV